MTAAQKPRNSKLVLDNNIKLEIKHSTNPFARQPMEITFSGIKDLKRRTIKIDPLNFPA